MLLSQFCPNFFRRCVHKSVLCACVSSPALQIGELCFCVHTGICLHVHYHVCTCMCDTCMCVHTCMWAYTCALCTCVWTHVCTCTCAHRHVCVYIVVQSPSRVLLFATPRTAALQASLSLTISLSLPKFMSIASVMPSSIRDFSNESAIHIRWPKYWSFSFSISPPSNEYSGLVSLKIDLFDLLTIQGTFRGLLQHHSSKPSIILHSAFFTVQLSHHWEDHVALTIWTCVGRVMSPLFNTLSRFVCVYMCVCVCVCEHIYI